MHAWHQNSEQGTQKNCAPERLIISALKLPPFELVDFKDMNRNFKTLFKKIYAVALDSCYKLCLLKTGRIVKINEKYAFVLHCISSFEVTSYKKL